MHTERKELTALGMGTSSCVPDGARTANKVCPEESNNLY